ncbi:translation initiation factor IF-2-like [Pipra filicauda]|uniref:Translation initiation factor IF-2-like n=1 Tax=Pipra filicauda TaxID=649802 RepID=A0A7R5KGG9_9PASS|nr:translation initiation factor IF-2-like [Pipra filicauda]XP_039236732.1 translation initiation factor IF-2-like [Pipra filicauda]XP_039236733.1 translation initiation factor IF-2-like [Pipra filicauda]
MRRRGGRLLRRPAQLSPGPARSALSRGAARPRPPVRPARLPPPLSPAANRAAHRPRRRPGGPVGDGGFRPSLLSSPRGLVHTLRGERRPCPGLASSSGKVTGTVEPSTEAPSGTAAVVATAAGPTSATAGCRAPPGLAPCPCLAAASDSECQAAPFPFLPSLPPAPSPLPAFPRRLPPAPGARLPPAGPGAAATRPAGPRRSRARGRPPLPVRECREPCARCRRAAPGWLSGGCSDCVSVSCLCLGGRRRGAEAGPSRSHAAQRQAQSAQPAAAAGAHRPPAPRGAPGRYTWVGRRGPRRAARTPALSQPSRRGGCGGTAGPARGPRPAPGAPRPPSGPEHRPGAGKCGAARPGPRLGRWCPSGGRGGAWPSA